MPHRYSLGSTSLLFVCFGLSDGNRHEDDGDEGPSAAIKSNKHANRLNVAEYDRQALRPGMTQ